MLQAFGGATHWNTYRHCLWPRLGYPTGATHLTGSKKAAGKSDGMLFFNTTTVREIFNAGLPINSGQHGYNLSIETKSFWATPTATVYEAMCSRSATGDNGAFTWNSSSKVAKLGKQVGEPALS